MHLKQVRKYFFKAYKVVDFAIVGDENAAAVVGFFRGVIFNLFVTVPVNEEEIFFFLNSLVKSEDFSCLPR